MKSSLPFVALLSVLHFNSPVRADIETTLFVDLGVPAGGGTFQLTGQSAYVESQVSSGTSGGHLDGFVSGTDTITFPEFFPPDSIADYISFSYFGRIDTYDDAGGLVDTSIVLALQSGVGEGAFVESFFPVNQYPEAAMVSAFASHDSVEFLNILGEIGDVGEAKGEFTIPSIGRVGTTLDLIAFIGGANGDEGVKVGELSVTKIPEPTALFLFSVTGGLALLRRRAR